MTVRRNILALAASDQARVIAALNAMKQDGSYDTFTERHHMNMMARTPGSGAYASSTRNRGHRGPAFGPWHRWSLLEFEAVLVAHGAPHLPYWAWERESGSWRTSPRTGIWALVGGTGTVTAPFSGWHARLYDATTGMFVDRSTEGIRRSLGASVPSLPTQADVDSVMALSTYDTSPCDDTSRTVSFRNGLEGWLLRGTQSHSMHNRVHTFIGGDMIPGTSPNDPLFWFNHANVDRLWWTWQLQRGITRYPSAGTGFPVGHGPDDVLRFLTRTTATPRAALDSRALGVDYDTTS